MKKPRLRLLLRHVSFWRTLCVNLRLFPLKTALKFPVLCGSRCDIAGLRRGCVVLNGIPRLGAIVWGITTAPRFSEKGLWTFIRFSRGGRLTCGPGFILRGGASLIVTGDNIKGYSYNQYLDLTEITPEELPEQYRPN